MFFRHAAVATFIYEVYSVFRRLYGYSPMEVCIKVFASKISHTAAHPNKHTCSKNPGAICHPVHILPKHLLCNFYILLENIFLNIQLQYECPLT